MLDKEQLSTQYGVSEKTISNWQAKAVECGGEVPWDAPEKMVDWYEVAYGRKAPKKLRLLVASYQLPVVSEKPIVPVSEELELETGNCKLKTPIQTLESFADMLGLSGTAARVVQEEERAYRTYMKLRNENADGVPGARKNWVEATEAKRAISKTDDAVELATIVLKEWVMTEWESRWVKLRRLLENELCSRFFESHGDGDEEVWKRDWVKEFELILAEWEESDE